MKNFYQKPLRMLSLEKDDKQNLTGMQLRVWAINNGTTILLRLYKHDPRVYKKLWDGQRTNGDVNKIVLSMLKECGVIINEDNWERSSYYADILISQEDFEDKNEYIYFAWSVKPELLHFLTLKCSLV